VTCLMWQPARRTRCSKWFKFEGMAGARVVAIVETQQTGECLCLKACLRQKAGKLDFSFVVASACALFDDHAGVWERL